MRRTASSLLDVVPDGNDVIDLVFEGANPNPARLACPARVVLEQLAGRALPIEHAGYRHLAQCSPCYRESRIMRTRESELPNHGNTVAASAEILSCKDAPAEPPTKRERFGDGWRRLATADHA